MLRLKHAGPDRRKRVARGGCPVFTGQLEIAGEFHPRGYSRKKTEFPLCHPSTNCAVFLHPPVYGDTPAMRCLLLIAGGVAMAYVTNVDVLLSVPEPERVAFLARRDAGALARRPRPTPTNESAR